MLSVRGLDWRLSQLGFDSSYGKLVCLATLMSFDRTKQICQWMTIYIYIYIYIVSGMYFKVERHGRKLRSLYFANISWL